MRNREIVEVAWDHFDKACSAFRPAWADDDIGRMSMSEADRSGGWATWTAQIAAAAAERDDMMDAFLA